MSKPRYAPLLPHRTGAAERARARASRGTAAPSRRALWGSVGGSAVVLAGLLLVLAAAPAFAAAPASAADASASGAPSSQPALAGPLKPALANSNPPAIRELFEEAVFATHAHIDARVEEEGHTCTWRGEYAPAAANGEPPPGKAGEMGSPWTIAGGGELPFTGNSVEAMSLGEVDRPTEFTMLHHLKPDTHYYARFTVESDAPTVSRTFAFTTLSVGKPEVPNGQYKTEYGSTFEPEEFLGRESLSPTTDAFKAQIETEGAETEYHFEYTTTPNNAASWLPFTAGGSGTITKEEDFAEPVAKLTGLTPETTYYARVRASNQYGAVEVHQWGRESESFTTLTAKPAPGSVLARNITASSAHVNNNVGTTGLETSWRYEYATSPSSATWTTAASGTISAAQAANGVLGGLGNLDSTVSAVLDGLQPGTRYFVRLFAKNSYGFTTSKATEFTTEGAPSVESFATHALHGEAVRVLGSVDPESVPTSDEQTVTVEGAPTGGTFTLTFDGHTTGAGATAKTTAGSTEAALIAISGGAFTEGELVSGPGIAPGTTVVSVITPEDAENRTKLGEPTSPVLRLSQPATATATGVALTANLPYDASVQSVQEALQALPGEPPVDVDGLDGGPYTVYFFGADGGVSEPQISGDGSGLTPFVAPSRVVNVSTIQEGGEAYDAHYHFEYVSQGQFAQQGAAGGFAKADATPEVELGSGDVSQVVGEDLPSLKAGETYDYRIVATNNSLGNPVVDGATHTLTVPLPASVQAPAACPNAAFRTGASAALPDCRAYEQVTPVDKEGSEELYQYGDGISNETYVGEDGNNLLLEATPVTYGVGPNAGGSPYLFTRDPEKGWQIASGSPQPATGYADVTPAIFGPDLTQFAFLRVPTPSSGESGHEFEYGPLAGPYRDAANVPAKDLKGEVGLSEPNWVGASADFSRLFLQVPDHSLAGALTTTKHGSDLYEYSAGRVRQVNVGIGACGAHIAHGEEGTTDYANASPHAVSSDGSRVFFEAVPGSVCSGPSHLYMRVNETETVDLGAYTFMAANAQGTEVLLKRRSGEAEEFFLYNAESASSQPKLLFSTAGAITATVSEDLSSIYFRYDGPGLTPEAPAGVGGEGLYDLYRYDLAEGKLSFIAQLNEGLPPEGGDVNLIRARIFEASPDGRYLYFNDAVAGIPAGGAAAGASEQAFLYDSMENVVECVSCASTFDPEPKRAAHLGDLGGGAGAGSGRGHAENGSPRVTLLSANGDFAFFDTPAALVPQDIDGELPVDESTNINQEFASNEFSPSSDVYEWRRDGIDGCAQVQGCLALITSGQGGVLNMLLGATPSGSDVFVYTKAGLAPSDVDSAGDIYDVRLDGGFPPPPAAPVECEGDACSTPPSAPGNPTATLLPPGAPPAIASKPVVNKKTVKCAKGKKLSHGKCLKVKPKPKKRSKAKKTNNKPKSDRGHN